MKVYSKESFEHDISASKMNLKASKTAEYKVLKNLQTNKLPLTSFLYLVLYFGCVASESAMKECYILMIVCLVLCLGSMSLFQIKCRDNIWVKFGLLTAVIGLETGLLFVSEEKLSVCTTNVVKIFFFLLLFFNKATACFAFFALGTATLGVLFYIEKAATDKILEVSVIFALSTVSLAVQSSLTVDKIALIQSKLSEIVQENDLLKLCLAACPSGMLILKDGKVVNANSKFVEEFVFKMINMKLQLHPVSEIAPIVDESCIFERTDLLTESTSITSQAELDSFKITELAYKTNRIFFFEELSDKKLSKNSNLLVGKISHEFTSILEHLKEQIKGEKEKFADPQSYRKIKEMLTYTELLVSEIVDYIDCSDTKMYFDSRAEVNLSKALRKTLLYQQLYCQLNAKRNNFELLIQKGAAFEANEVISKYNYKNLKKFLFYLAIYITKISAEDEAKLQVSFEEKEVSLNCQVPIRQKTLRNMENKENYSEDQGLHITKKVLETVAEKLKIKLKEIVGFSEIKIEACLKAEANFSRKQTEETVLEPVPNEFSVLEEPKTNIDLSSRKSVNPEGEVFLRHKSKSRSMKSQKVSNFAGIPREGVDYYLVCDDDGVMLRSHANMLRKVVEQSSKQPSCVCEFEDAAEVIYFLFRCLKGEFKGEIKMVLTDQFMKLVEGSEMIALVKKRMEKGELNQFPFICCTAFSDSYNLERIQESGVDKLVNKPLSKVELQCCMEELDLL